MKKAMILNGSLKEQNNLLSITHILEEELTNSGWETGSLLLNEIDIKPCLGCFGCFDKTPGICVINDEAREIAKKIINKDLVIYLSPLTFGGWSSELKKMLDRQLPLIQAGFVKKKGEYHHKKRYKKYPSIIGIAVSHMNDEEEERIFKDLVRRNSLSSHSPKHGAVVFQSGEKEKTVKDEIHRLFIDMEVIK